MVATGKKMESPYRTIYLQYDKGTDDEITWCQDRIDNKDTEYWRSDVTRTLAEAVLVAHKGKGHCIDCPHVEYGEDYQRCTGGEYDCCRCSACVLARDVLHGR
jgi:hypothetical protein